eukprot:jgi/Galph1/537/GphlegSOOS_G5218.1
MAMPWMMMLLAFGPFLAIFTQFWFQQRIPTLSGEYDVGTIDVLVYRPLQNTKVTNCSGADVCVVGLGPYMAPDVNPGLPVDVSAPQKLIMQLFYPVDKGNVQGSLWNKLTGVFSRKRASILPDVSFLGWRKQFPHPYVKHTLEVLDVSPKYAWLLSLASFVGTHAKVYAPISTRIFKQNNTLPVILFSHGLFANRLSYSVLCSELASQGYLVVSVDHTDGSVPVVFFKDGDILPYRYFSMQEKESPELRETIRVLQAHRRVADLQVALNALQILHHGPNSLFHLPPNINFHRKLQLQNISVIGHSFGGATCLLASYLERRVKSCLALDPWMLAIPDELLKSFPSLNASVVCIHTDNFQDVAAMEKISKMMQQSTKAGHYAAQWKLLGASHESQADYALFLPSVIQRTLNMSVGKTSPQLVHQLDNRIAVEFIKNPSYLSELLQTAPFQKYLQFLPV